MMGLTQLLASMTPTLDVGAYVFCTTSQDRLGDIASIDGVQMLFREAEGWTIILPQHKADELALLSAFPCKKITLNVHSSLDAVGFIATIARKLAELEIGVNPVSGFYHDHLFIPVGKEGEVMDSLRNMTEGAQREIQEGAS